MTATETIDDLRRELSDVVRQRNTAQAREALNALAIENLLEAAHDQGYFHNELCGCTWCEAVSEGRKRLVPVDVKEGG